ncbi:MAG: RHS repeat-associated core domain-containing protein [Candidatus Acidiferrales bacterium]
MTRPNSLATNYTYDNKSRLLSVLHQLSGSTIDGASYTVDAAGNRTAKTDQLASVTSNYTYDSIYELTQVTQGGTTTESYSYDAVGNRTASLGVSSYTNNSSNELTATSNASYTYDSNGNMSSKTNSAGTTNYAWDYENRLASVSLPSSSGTATFKYDPFGRRIQKSFTQGSTTTTTNYLYDGDNDIEEVNASGSILARYTQTQNIDEPLAESRSSTTSFYEADGLGSVTSLTNSSAAVVATYTYDSFGSLTASSGTLTNPFRYTARELDTETGLNFYRARYYDPSTSRFQAEDPIRFRGGINFYAYVNNRPTLLRDPSGRACWGGGASGTAVLTAFWFGTGVEGTIFMVGDSQGNYGVLDCAGGGFGASSGVGGSVGLQGMSIFSPNCNSICDMQGGFGGATAFAGAGATGMYSASLTLGMTTATVTVGGGGGFGAGFGLVGIGGDCMLIWKRHSCPSCPKSKK